MIKPIKPTIFRKRDVSINSKLVTSPSFLEAKGLKLSLDSITIRFLAAEKKNILAQLAIITTAFCLGLIFAILVF